MKKIKYYAPYWVTAIIVISLIIAIVLLRKWEQPTLYDYALTMESSDYFIRDDRSIWQFSKELDNGYIKIKPTDETSKTVKNYTDKENLGQMSLYEFALAAHGTVYIRQDGSAWADMGTANTNLPNIATEIKAIDYDLAPVSTPQLSATLYAAGSYIVQLNMTNYGDTAISTPYVYLFVQLEDGKWYPYVYAYDHNVTVPGKQVFRGDDVEIEYDPDLQPGDTDEYYIHFPRNSYIHSTLTGRYCIAVFSNAYYDYRPSGENAVYTTYPISENAELIATIEFDIVPKNEIDRKLTNFESSIEDFTLPKTHQTMPAS